VFNNFIFPENRTVCDIIWKKYGTRRQDTDDNTTTQGFCMLDK